MLFGIVILFRNDILKKGLNASQTANPCMELIEIERSRNCIKSNYLQHPRHVPKFQCPLIVTTALCSWLTPTCSLSGGKRRPDFQVQDNVHFHVIQIPVMTSGYPHEAHVVHRNRSILNLQHQNPTTDIYFDVLPFGEGNDDKVTGRRTVTSW